jgi:hypothetical protein
MTGANRLTVGNGKVNHGGAEEFGCQIRFQPTLGMNVPIRLSLWADTMSFQNGGSRQKIVGTKAD